MREPLPRAALIDLDLRLVRLGRGAGGLRLRLGEALEALGRAGGHHALGFSSMAAYSLERVGQRGRWAADSRAVARRVAELPRTRAALLAGRVSWSMAEVLSRWATPETEAALLVEACGSTVRAMRARLAQGAPEPEPDPERRTLTVTLDKEEAWAVEAARMMVGVISGTTHPDEVVMAMLAEGTTSLQGLGVDVPETIDPVKEAGYREWRETVNRWRREAEEACETRIPRDVVEVEPVQDEPLPGGAEALDAVIRRLAGELASRHLDVGEAALAFFAANGWRRLGYASAGQYARERVGVAHSAVKARMTLARRCARLPAVAEALREGRIGLEAASMVARVATGQTVHAWVRRAEARTVVHLREEVEAAELIERTGGETQGPPTEATLEEVRAAERSVLSVAAGRMSGGGPLSQGGSLLKSAPGKVSWTVRVRVDLAEQWRDVEAAWRRSRAGTSFVGFLCAAVWHTWAGSVEAEVAYAEVYWRDLWRCASPVCSRWDVTPHHIVFRSQGGGDELSNLVSLCSACHLELVHGQRLKVTGEAPRLTWRLGGGVEVRGRTLVRSGSAVSESACGG